MNKKVMPRDFMIYLFLFTVMFYSLVKATYKLTPVQYKFDLILFSITIPMIYIHFLSRYKYAWVSILLVFLIPRPLYILKYLISMALQSKEFINSLIQSQNIQTQYYNYFNSLMYIIIILLVILFYYVVIIKEKTLIFLISGAILFSVYYFFVNDVILSNCRTFLLFGLILYVFNNYVSAKYKWKNEESETRQNHFKKLLWITVIFILFLNIFSKIMPYKSQSVSFEWFEENIVSKFENVKGSTERIFKNPMYKSSYNLSYTGYQPKAKRLGGPVKLNNEVVLRIYSDFEGKELHLRGSIKDNYNGQMWQKTDLNTEKIDGELNTGNYAMPYKYKNIRIAPVKLKTTTIFNALYPFQVKINEKNIYIDSDNEIYSRKSIKSGREYEVTYKEYSITEKVLSSVKNEEDYNENLNKYLQLPQKLPDRVIELTNKITRGYDTPYEKVSAIENYLKNNYPYDLKTSYLPEGMDFVDYFLFVEKKGSCTYYATAMAIMSRIVNVPSRYVEGFAIYFQGNKKEYIDVLNADAHAWIELYFQGVGWVAFDPTPGHFSPSASLKSREQEDNQAYEADNEENNPQETGNNSPQKKNKEIEDDENSNLANDTAKRIGAKEIIKVITLVSLILSIVLVACLMIYNRHLQINKNLIKHIIYKLFLYGEYLGIPYLKGETLKEYSKKIKWELGVNLDEFVDIFEELTYGNKNIEDYEYKLIINKVNQVKNMVIARRGKLHFYTSEILNMFDILRKTLKKEL